MNNEEIREYSIAKSDVTEGFPFDDTAAVFYCTKAISYELRDISN